MADADPDVILPPKEYIPNEQTRPPEVVNLPDQQEPLKPPCEVDPIYSQNRARRSYFSRSSQVERPKRLSTAPRNSDFPSFLRQSIPSICPNNPAKDDVSESSCEPKQNLRGIVNALLDANLKVGLAPLSLREKAWITFEEPSSSNVAQALAIWIMVLILLSCISFIVETDIKYVHANLDVFKQIEFFCIIQFTIEYCVRLLVCPDKIQFCKSFLNAIDLLAIMPFYIEEFLNFDSNTAFLRIIRLARVFRVFKISRYLTWITVFVNAVVNSAQPLFMLLYVMLIATVFFSSIMYFLERGDWNSELRKYQRINPRTQKLEFSPYQSIPGTFWWCIITMTTVGYGDAVPITWQGRILASIASLCGILVFAVPITVISKTFDSELNHMRQLQKLGIGKLRSLKKLFVQAKRKENTEEGKLSAEERKNSRYRRKEIMIDLINYLQSDDENFDWDQTKHLTASNLRAMLSFFVTNQIAAVVAEADSQLLNNIKRSIDEHRRDVQYEIKVLLNELPDAKSSQRIKHFERHVEDIFLHRNNVAPGTRPSRRTETF